MNNAPLTPEELEWAKQNAAVIRTAMASSVKDEAHHEAPEDAVQRATHFLTRSISRKIARVNAKEREVNDRIALYKRIAAGDSSEIDWVAEYLPEAEEALPKIAAHKSALEEKLASLRRDPERCFLPLGTVVRFAERTYVEDSLELGDRRKDYPVPGSVGVVTGLNLEDEYFLRVTMRREFTDGWENARHPGPEQPPTFYIDPDMVEVIGYGSLPDGSEYTGYGFVQTHESEDEDEEAEMILEADGFFWRLQDFGGTQGIECLGAYEDIAEMEWISGPVDQFRPLASRGPKPR
jgi:hypothetical protein